MSESAAPAIIFTDDGWILSATQPPVTAADLQAKVVDGYAGIGGAFGWSLGDHEVYQYETERGEIFGQGRTSFDDGLRSFVHSPTPGVMPRIAENIRALIAEGGGPMTILTRQSRKAGLPFFPRVRMNSHYDMDPDHPGYGRFRRERPDLMIGRPGESIPEGTVEWGIKTGLDFTFPEVREHRLSIVEEVVERFDVDGVELDFMRHPAFFRPGRGLWQPVPGDGPRGPRAPDATTRPAAGGAGSCGLPCGCRPRSTTRRESGSTSASGLPNISSTS